MATPTKSPEIRFSDYVLDLRTGELRKNGVILRLQPQPARILAILASRPGEVITRQELAQKVWGSETYVDFEHGLNYAIRQIRSVLEDDAEEPRYLETVPKCGYRFIAPVTDATESRSMTQSTGSALVLRQSRSRLVLISIAAATLALVVLALVRGWPWKKAINQRIGSLAVLPLRNLSADPEQEYFSDGMTDELITDLAKLGSLRVISHTSVERYRNTKQALPEIARELGVDAIVEGAVLRSNDRVRITAQLIDASDRHLWAESYERNLGDILALQGRLAQDIAEEVRIKLTPQAQSRLATARKTTSGAYDAYLRGRYLWNQRNAEAIAIAIQYFQQAVHEDPNFAAAYSGLADCYWVGWGAKQDIPLADKYARKAISLQPDMAEAHASLGNVLVREHQMDKGGDELRRALELNPNYAMAHQLYASYLLTVGRPADALAESDRALQLDPFSAPINNMRTIILIDSRNYDEALNQALRLKEIIPKSQWVYQQLARIYWLQGKVPEAIEEEKKTAVLAHSEQWLRDQEAVAMTYKRSGMRAARFKAAQLAEQTRSIDFDGIWAAFAYGGAGDSSGVLRCLERTLHDGVDGNLELQLQTAPEFDFLRTDQRYLDLRHRLGLH